MTQKLLDSVRHVASTDKRLSRHSVYSYVYIVVRPYTHACVSILKKAAGCFSEMVVPPPPPPFPGSGGVFSHTPNFKKKIMNN